MVGSLDWRISKQSTVAQSTTKAEYIAGSEASKEAFWIRKFIDDLDVVPSIKNPMEIFCDNSVAITMPNDFQVQKGSQYVPGSSESGNATSLPALESSSSSESLAKFRTEIAAENEAEIYARIRSLSKFHYIPEAFERKEISIL